MLNKITTLLNNLQEVRCNPMYGKEVIDAATKMFNDGWDKLEDGIVVLSQGNCVAIKKGNKMVKQEMKNFSIREGVLTGDIVAVMSEIEIPEAKKEQYLGQAIITKYYTIKRA